jgi:pyruvate dehydrogenase (quinone)
VSQTVAEFMLHRLHDQWDVARVYGYPGDGINGFMGAFQELGGKPEFIQVRHEVIAGYAACAHAKFTGEVGVCIATSGPGAIQLLNGLYDAKLDHQPVVAVVGQQQRVSLGSDWLQEVDLHALLKDVGEFVQTCMAPEQAAHLVDRAMRVAMSSRTVACIVVPVDVQHAGAEEPERAHGSVFSSAGLGRAKLVPEDDELRHAAEVLNAGKRPAILIGQGAAGAQQEVIEAAEVLDAGVAKALNGRAALPDDLPFVTGSIGLLGTKPSSDMMAGCDTLLMIGSNFPFADWLPEEGQARGVQIDIDGRLIGMRYPMEVSLVGDSRHTLRALLPLLERREDRRSWRERIEKEVDRWWRVLEERAMMPAKPLNPMRVFQELSPLLPDGCILTADSGTSANWWARHLKLRAGMKAGISGTLATMGCAVPYALGAKFAHPDRPVIAAVGDGAMQMIGNNALVDLVHHADRWHNKQCVVLVLNNGDLNEVTWEQRAMSGDPRYEVSQTLPAFPFARYAEMLGVKGIRVDDPDRVRDGWEEALAHDGLVLYEAVTDPNMPPLPPQLRFETVRNMTRAFMKGDPAARDIMRHAIRATRQDLTTR